MSTALRAETSAPAGGPAVRLAARQRTQGLPILRLCMVLANLAPLFLLWAVEGTPYVPDSILLTTCAAAVVLPHGILLLRVRAVRRAPDARPLVVEEATDNRYHLFAYLFAILMPFYRHEIVSLRSTVAAILALTVVILLFYRLDMVYVNVLLAALGYRIYGLMTRPDESSPHEDGEPVVLVSRRRFVRKDDRIHAVRVTATLYWERTT